MLEQEIKLKLATKLHFDNFIKLLPHPPITIEYQENSFFDTTQKTL